MTELCIPLIARKTVAHKDAIFLMLDKLPEYCNNTWCKCISMIQHLGECGVSGETLPHIRTIQICVLNQVGEE